MSDGRSWVNEQVLTVMRGREVVKRSCLRCSRKTWSTNPSESHGILAGPLPSAQGLCLNGLAVNIEC